MGYSTDFHGEFKSNKPFDPDTRAELDKLREDRHEDGYARGLSIWCQWEAGDDTLFWDGGEKFYSYVPWLKHIINNILKPRGYVLNGEVHWQGEESEDMGIIRVVDNEVKIGTARIEFDFD